MKYCFISSCNLSQIITIINAFIDSRTQIQNSTIFITRRNTYYCCSNVKSSLRGRVGNRDTALKLRCVG